MSASIVRASSRLPCSSSSRARLIVARSSHLRLHLLRECDCLAKAGPGQFGLTKFEPQVPADAQGFGTEIEFLAARRERLLDGDESVVDLAIESLGLGQTCKKIRDPQPR